MAERPSAGGRRRALTAMGAILLPLLWGCSLLTPKPELLERWERYEVADTTGLVQVAVFTSPSPSDRDPPAFVELSKSAQAAYVRSLADRTSSVEELQRALAAPVGVADAGNGTVDRTRFRRRLVISVARSGPGGVEADGPSRVARIARMRIALRLDTASGRFTSWDRFATRYDTVDLGTMSLSRSAGLDAEIDLTPGVRIKEAGPIGLDASGGATLDESLPLSERYVSNGILRPGSMSLLQEGAAGIDLVGNSVVEIELRLPRAATATSTLHRFGGLFDETGAARPADSLRIGARRLLHPSRAAVDAGDVVAELRHEALVRTVRRGKGDATYTEGDDHVRFLEDTGAAGPVVLVPARDLRVSAWNLVTNETKCRILQIEHPDEGSRPGAVPGELRFETAGEARRFLRWLRERHASPPGPGASERNGNGPGVAAAGRTLYLEVGSPLPRSRIPELSVRLHPLNWAPAGGSPVCS